MSEMHSVEKDAPKRAARCGADFDHKWHSFRDEGDDRRHVCDGLTRPIPPEATPTTNAARPEGDDSSAREGITAR